MPNFNVSPEAVAKARASGYSDTEIADYLSQQMPDKFKAAADAGYTPTEILDHLGRVKTSPPPAPVSTLGTVEAAGTGLVRGVESAVGGLGDMSALTDAALQRAGVGDTVKRLVKAGLSALNPAYGVTNALGIKAPTTSDVISAETNLTGGLHKAANPIEQGVENVASFVPASLAGEGNLATRVLMQGVAPGAASEVAGDLTKGTTAELPARVLATLLVPSSLKSKALAPSTEEIRNAANAGYDAARSMPVYIKPSSAATWADTTAVDLAKSGFNDKLAPKTHSVLQEFQGAPLGASVSMENLDTARQTLGRIASNYTEPVERAAATRAIQGLDDFAANLKQSDVLSGDANAAANTWATARANYAALKRAGAIADARNAASLSADAANSGQNIGNATRQEFKKFVLSDEARGLTEAERAQAEKVIRGTWVANLLRRVSNVFGGGGGVPQGIAMAAGGYAGSQTGEPGGTLEGAMLPLIAGAMARRWSNASVLRQAAKLDAMVRARSPLGQAQELTAQLAQPQSMPISVARVLNAKLAAQGYKSDQ